MKLIYDKVYVEVKGVYHDDAYMTNEQGEKVKLFIPRKNYEENPLTQHKVTSGKVHYVCQLLKKDNMSNNSHFTPESWPKSILSHHRGHNFKKEIEVRDGDYVYFNYNALSEKTRYEVLPNGNETHIIDYSSIFAFDRGGVLHCPTGKSLLEIQYQDETTTIEHEGRKQEVVMSKSGLIVDLKPKKDKRRAVIAVMGKTIGPDHKADAQLGDEVIIGKNKNFKVIINGREFYSVNHNGLLGKWHKGKMVPYADYIVVKPEKTQSSCITIVEDQYEPRGEVIRKGPLVPNYIQIGHRAHFAENKDRYSYFDEDSRELLIKSHLVFAHGLLNVKIISKNNWN